MCGRTAQTQGAVFAASSSLRSTSGFRGNLVDNIGSREPPSDIQDSSSKSNDAADGKTSEGSVPEVDGSYPWHDNFNLSPGHNAVVFAMNKKGKLQMDRKTWGLVTKGGTSTSPLPSGASKHFANLMFNARSDTLFSKPTFAKLLNEGKTCLVALDGFFEWKADVLGGGKGKKQPFYVYRNPNGKMENDTCDNANRPYLLMAGLWTSVSTGYSSPKPERLDTFTILTTEVCNPLKWLHSRMPVCIWDEDLAMKWLQQPSQKVLEQLDRGANQTNEALLMWHEVSTQMSSVKFRSSDAIKAIPKPKSVKSFFAPANKQNQKRLPPNDKSKTKVAKANVAKGAPSPTKTPSNNSTLVGKKRPAPVARDKTPSNIQTIKRVKPSQAVVKRGSITSFFSPKKPKKE